MRRATGPTRLILAGLKVLGVAVILVWSLGPVYWSIVTSLSRSVDLTSRPLHLFPPRLTLQHYAHLFGASGTFQGTATQSVWPEYRHALLNSLVTCGLSTVVVLVLTVAAGYAFTRLRFFGRDALFAAIVATMAIPVYTVMIPVFRIMVSLKLIDTYLGITLVYATAFAPLALWLMRSFYQSIPVSLEEAAWIDGASRLHALWRIVLPLAAPGIVAAAIVTFLNAWAQFVIPLVFSTTFATKPLTVLIPTFVTRNYVNYGLMNAAGVLAMIPPILVVVFLNRYLINGLTTGSSK